MSYRAESIAAGEYYHVMNRGVEKRLTFLDDRDYRRFIDMMGYYRRATPPTSFSQRTRIQLRKLDMHDWGDPIVEIVAYCLMPNHFHLLIRPLSDGGLATFMARLSNGYTRAFNTRNARIGPLFQGSYKAVHIQSNWQLLHVCRYIFLNPVVAKLSNDASSYHWSACGTYTQGKKPPFYLSTDPILGQFASPTEFQDFVDDHAAYAQTLATYKHLLLENE